MPLTDLQDRTPAEIDGAWAKAQLAAERHLQRRETAKATIERIENATGADARLPWNSPGELAEARAAIEDAQAHLNAYNDEAGAYDAEWARRGGWTRYWLVTNAGGHVHPTRACTTCYPSTTYALLTEQSGMTREDLVDLAGEKACTVCFPDAPVDVLRRRTRLEAPAAKAARQEREEAKAKRDAERAAKAITMPDGGPVKDRYGSAIKTERAALTAAVSGLADLRWYGTGHPMAADWTRIAEDVAVAVAAKRGRPAQEVRDELARKAAAKYARDQREAERYARTLGVARS